MHVIPEAVLVAATVGNGLLAGMFFAFSCGVAPGLRRVDDRAYVTAFRAISRSIVNLLFLLVFLGAPIATAAAAALHLDGARQEVLACVVAALALSLLSFAVTVLVNVPLNNRLDSTEPVEEARALFERRWVRWNAVRTVVCTLSFLALVPALAQL